MTKEQFYSQQKIEINQMIPNDIYRNYKLKDTKQVIFELTIDSGLGGEEVEIDMMNDVHLNYCNEEDEKDEEVMLTKKCRPYNADGSSVNCVIGSMDVAQYADQTVFAGDTLDFLSMGNIELMKKHIYDRDPNVLIPIGGHETSKHVLTGLRDKLSYQERLDILQKHWIHDIHYATKDVKDKVICVGLDNAPGKYAVGLAEKLQADVERARKENKIILLFQHEPLSTGVPADADKQFFFNAYRGNRNFYDGVLIFSKSKPQTEENMKMYEVLKNGADVIKGVFAGHFHSLFYTEIVFENGNKIPQYTCVGNAYFGYDGVVTRIFVK